MELKFKIKCLCRYPGYRNGYETHKICFICNKEIDWFWRTNKWKLINRLARKQNDNKI